jgi:DNA-directed RNA polymerase subunit RPC12/RpoP
MNYKIFKCKRCNHEWPSKQERPRVCPKCKSPYWDKERKNAPNKAFNKYLKGEPLSDSEKRSLDEYGDDNCGLLPVRQFEKLLETPT